MNYEMKLYPNYFNKIKTGEKKIEIRLFDEKRKEIRVGDRITFFKLPDLSERIDACILDLKTYTTFEKLVNDFEIVDMGFEFNTKEELLKSKVMNSIYSEEEIRANGLVAFKIQKC